MNYICISGLFAVSYTHLDVYKRQSYLSIHKSRLHAGDSVLSEDIIRLFNLYLRKLCRILPECLG